MDNKNKCYTLSGIYRPKFIQKNVWQLLLVQFDHLNKMGWDRSVIKAYYKYVKNEFKNVSDEFKIEELINHHEQEFKLVGSKIYTYLYEHTRYSSVRKIQLVLDQLDATFDEYNFLQLNGNFKISHWLKPNGKFLLDFRKDVQHVFSKKALVKYAIDDTNNLSLLAKKIHCFRSYLDLQAINYIRTYQHGLNDFEKLLDYSRQYNIKLDYKTGANYHNRFNGSFEFPKNMKVQLPQTEKMTEFIVDLNSGEFVSEWNVYRYTKDGLIDSNPDNYTKEQLEQVANTESFNYGRPQHASHKNLDIKHPKDPNLRVTATKIWKFERDFDDGGNYADIVNSGGLNDYKAWKLVSKSDKLSAYQNYVNECKNLNLKRNYGFSSYYFDKMIESK